MSSIFKKEVQKILALADVQISGNRPWDITVSDERFYKKVLLEGSLGLGESYMDGWWDSQKLDEFFARVLSARLGEKVGSKWRKALRGFGSIIFNMQSRTRAFQVGEQHYDIGNDLYEAMLDKRMVYTCGYWSPSTGSASSPQASLGQEAKTLDEAQEAKLDLVCRKLGLRPGQRILDIGCGWGRFAKFAAEKYGVSVVGVTISKEQVSLGQKRCEGLSVEILLKDYREIEGEFDHIVSLGMFEHVGYKNYRVYMEVAREHLKNGGLFLLHTIGNNFSKRGGDVWVRKYIFPNGMLPSVKQIGKSIEGLFVMEDWHNFGADYDKTLMAWQKNFEDNWDKISPQYSERFRRMWNYYLLSFAGSFRARNIQLWQIVLSKDGVPGGYKSTR